MGNGLKNDLSSALDKLNETLKGAPDATLTEVGQLAATMIFLRTKKGLDADRNVFKPYSKAYAKRRARKGLRIDPPDLAVKGHMLGAIEPKITGPNEVTMTFNNPYEAQKAGWNTAMGRDFFDVRADAEIEAIADAIGDQFVAEILKK